MRRLLMFAATAAALLGFSAAARAQFLIVGDDNKLHWDDAGKPAFTAPGKDEVVIVDIKDREAPKIVATLPLTNTIIGPPTNLAVTPDEKLALIANSLNYESNGSGGWKPVPDNKIFVIDLTANPPAQIATVEVGKQPSGMAINKAGTLALVADRADNAVTVLTISGKEVKPVQTVALGDTVSAVAITPDGKHALVCQTRRAQGGLARHRRAERELQQEGHRGRQLALQRPDHRRRPFRLDRQPGQQRRRRRRRRLGQRHRPQGRAAAARRLRHREPVPRRPRRLADGAARHRGGDQRQRHHAERRWFANPYSLLDVLSTADGHVRRIASVKAGLLPEGIAFSPEGKYVYVGNFSDSDLQIFKVEGDTLRDTGKVLKLPGHPASVRGNTP